MRVTAPDIYTLVGKNYLLCHIMEDTASDNRLWIDFFFFLPKKPISETAVFGMETCCFIFYFLNVVLDCKDQCPSPVLVEAMQASFSVSSPKQGETGRLRQFNPPNLVP